MIYAFGDHELDTSRFELRRAGVPQPVEPQVIELLAHLLEHRDRVVSREELLARVWGHPHVAEATVNSRIRAARAAIGDTGAAQSLIRTIRGRGYRFVGAVAPGAAPSPSGPERADPAPGLRPPALDTSGPLVDRDAELGMLREVWRDALAGAPRIACITGEPGIGKTRLIAALAEVALGDGRAVVLYGRCSEEALVPLEPFAGALGGLPSLDGRFGGTTDDVDGDPALARYRAFESVRSAVEQVAGARPCLLALDDLHWSDPLSLLVLRHLARTLRSAPLMLLLAYRDTDVGPDHPLRDALVDLRREHPLRTIPLRGLEAPAVQRLVRRIAPAGARLPPPASLAGLTGGNPFFIGEVVRAARDTGDHPDTPSADISELVVQRLRRLGPEVNATLETAALLGTEFVLADLEALAEGSADRVPAAIERAESARLVTETARPEWFAFTHGLVREALRRGMSAPRRRRAHLRIADVLAARDAAPTEVAHHLLAAMPAGDSGRAVTAARRAAASACRSLAFEDAADLLTRALEGLRAGRPDPADECRLLLEAGDAHAHAGAAGHARARFAEAAAIATTLGDPELLAAAALGAGGMAVAVLDRDPEVEGLLRRALAMAGDEPSATRARLLARLAIELRYADPEEAERLSARALAAARAPGAGDSALAPALTARRVAIWGPERAGERLDVADAIVRHAQAVGDRESELHGRNWRVLDLLELGRADAARNEVDAFAAVAEEVGLPHHLWYVPLWRATFACMEGRFADARVLSERARTIGRTAGDPNVDNFVRIQEFARPFESRDFAAIDLQEGLRQFASLGRPATWAGAIAVIQWERGHRADARATYDEVATDGFRALPGGVNWHVIVDYAEAAALLGDADGARVLYDVLAPHRGLCPVTARAVLCCGSAESFLGRLAATMGRHDLAVAHLEAGVAANEGLRALPRAAVSRWWLARVLVGRDAPGDRDRARTLLADAAALAERLGMTSFAAEVARSGDRIR